MLQLVFNKILTFPLDQFWVEKHGCGGGREGGWGQYPLSAWYAYFAKYLPQFVIAMKGRSRRCPLNTGFTVINTIIMY